MRRKDDAARGHAHASHVVSESDADSTLEEREEEEDLGAPRLAPALRLPSSTRRVPGAFPTASASASPRAQAAALDGTSSAPLDANKTSPSLPQNTSALDAESSAVGLRDAPSSAQQIRKQRSPLDAALVMQLRPGLGADGTWLVRFLMNFLVVCGAGDGAGV
ncbi:hypothetical protein DFH09DRAFT_1132437 [Mycena vulgaris]|nr:hypothetical protein DFH09DRAFT_1132437 [Mycena vulgaris]